MESWSKSKFLATLFDQENFCVNDLFWRRLLVDIWIEKEYFEKGWAFGTSKSTPGKRLQQKWEEFVVCIFTEAPPSTL